MPTPAERKALLFLAGVIVLGASVRVVRAARDDGHADAASRAALARQLAAVDSARSGEAERKRARPPKGFGGARRRSRQADTRPPPEPAATPVIPVDLDVAAASDIEALPRIGPVLARRIVEDRDANGPFGSIEGFERVRGVGPALAAALRARVTFSGTARPSDAVVRAPLRTSARISAPSPKPRRRERRNR
jgi:competence protein ComEA